MAQFFRFFLSVSLILPSPGFAQGNALSPNNSGLSPVIQDTPSEMPESGIQVEDLHALLQSPPTPEDTFHLIEQDLLWGGHSYPLYLLGDSPLHIHFDQLQYKIEGSDFIVIGLRGSKEVARHTFKNLNVQSYVADAEILFLMSREGQLHAIDKAFLKVHAFRGPIPVYKNLIQQEDYKEPLTMSFWTRGLPPSLFEGIDASPTAIFPRNPHGELIFTAGDIVLHRDSGQGLKALGLLSRQVLSKNIHLKFEELMLRTSITSPEVFENMDPKHLADLETRFEMNINTEEVAQIAFRSLPSESIKKLMEQAENLTTTSRKYDRATFEDWRTSFEDFQTQAKNNSKLNQLSQDFSPRWQEMEQARLLKNSQQLKKPGFFRRHGLVMAAVTGSTLALTGIASVYDAKLVMAVLDYLYAKVIPPIVKVEEFRYPLFSSVVALLCILPLFDLIGRASPLMMKSLALSLKTTSKSASQKMSALVETWESMHTWQRLVTGGVRVFSLISVAFWNHLGTILRQPRLFRTIKAGLNPFDKVRTHSQYGQVLELEEDLSLGINNPFLSSKELQLKGLQQQEAVHFLSQERLRTRHAAFQLVALTLYQEGEVDPATLALILKNEDSTAGLDESILRDLSVEKHREWVALSEVITNDWFQTLRTRGQIFNHVPADDFLDLLIEAKTRIKKYQNSGILAQRLLLFKSSAQRTINKIKNNIVLLGVEDGQILRTVYANDFVTDQVKKTVVTDHVLLVLLPAFWGDRANPEKPMIPGGSRDGTDRNLLSFRPNDGSIFNLWTNTEHLLDIWINVCSHFFSGGARQILLYQGGPKTVETNYDPIEPSLLKQRHEAPSFFTATSQWFLRTADTRESALGNYYMRSLSRQLRTIQASFLLNMVFRYTAGNPTLEQAFWGWYYFFVAGTWGYSWPWIIITQGNNLEAKSVQQNLKVLKEAQIDLAQALRLKHTELAPLTQKLRELYSPNPERSHQLLEALGEEPSIHSPKDEEQIAYAEALLRYTSENPPFPTKANNLPSWIATGVGALSTTMLAIPMGVDSLDHTFLTPQNMLMQTAYSAAGFAVAYVMISQNGVWSKTLNKIDSYLTRKKAQGQIQIQIQAPPRKRLLHLFCRQALEKI